jgi:3-oxoacyl-[acyl-carrier protein] reductase
MAGEESGIDYARLAPAPGFRLAVVGGCGGIGRALTRAALDIGLAVAVLDLERSLAEAPPPEGVALSVAVDATDEAAVTAAFDRVGALFGGQLDGLLNLAGFPNRYVEADALSAAEWDETVAGNLRSTYLSCRAALPLLRRAAEESVAASAIVNTASGLATRPLWGFAPYSASKAGVVALTKTIALEQAPSVRANVLAPGPVETAFHDGGTGRAPDAPNARARLDRETVRRMVPLRRIAEPADVVGPILFLLGPAARFMTGQVLHVNGGGQMP